MSYLKDIASRIETRSAQGIAGAVMTMVSDGLIPPGEKLPTTRDIAGALGVSAGMVSDAWKLLSADGILETHGRRGTFVRDITPTPWRQFRHVAGADLQIDLSTGFPDTELLIDLRPYLAQLSGNPPYIGYPENEIDTKLLHALRDRLPVSIAEDNVILATHVIGAMAEIMPTLGPPGTRVIVADPEFAPYLDLIERNRFIPTPVSLEADGMNLDEVRQAISAGAKAMLIQPRLHNPSGIRTSEAKLKVIAEMCESEGIWLFEGDFYGELLPSPRVSAATWAPTRTVYFTAFSKDIHPDIRVAVVAGSPRLIRETHRRRIGGFTVSRVNQDLLRIILEDPSVTSHVHRTRDIYVHRQRQFCQILRDKGINIVEGGAFNVWIPVESEHSAMVYLAAYGVNVAPGSAFQVESRAPHIRVSTNVLADNLEEIAVLVANAARVQRAGG